MKRFLATLLLLVLTVALLTGVALAESGDIYVQEGEKTVIFDQDGITVYFTGESSFLDNCNGKSGNFMVQLNCVVENNTDKTVTVSYNGVVNGWNLSANYTMTGASKMPAGTKAKSYVWFTTDDTDVTAYADLETMTLSFHVKDDDAGSALFDASTASLHFNAEAPMEEPEAEEPAEEPTEAAADAAQAAEAPAKPEADEANAEPEATAEAPAPTKAPPKEYPTLEVGSKGDDVKQLQQALIEQGFLSGGADGIFGKGTAAGVKAFQESNDLEATGVADSETQRKLFGDDEEPIEISLSGVTETDYMQVNGIFVDESFVDEQNPDLVLLCLYYTAKTPGDSYKVDCKDSTLSFEGSGNYTSGHFSMNHCLYAGSYIYTDYLREVFVGDGVNVCETFKVPKAELKPGRTMRFSSSQIADSNKISLSTDDIITLASPRAIAKVVDPEGYVERVHALAEADRDTRSKVVKQMNGYYWIFTTNNISYRIDFSKSTYKMTANVGGYKIKSDGKYTVCNGYVVTEVSNTHAITYIPYTLKDGKLDLDIAKGYDVKAN